MIELMIIILFFSLSSVIIVQLFAAAHRLSVQSSGSTKLLLSAQSWADRMLTEDDVTAFLLENGWADGGNGLYLEADGGTLWVSRHVVEKGTGGKLMSCEITAYVQEKEVFTLPVARYSLEGEP